MRRTALARLRVRQTPGTGLASDQYRSARAGDWSGVWQALSITDRDFQQMIESTNDRLAVAAAIAGSLRPTRFIDPASIRCPATYYVGSEDWIVPHVRDDVKALGATLDVI